MLKQEGLQECQMSDAWSEYFTHGEMTLLQNARDGVSLIPSKPERCAFSNAEHTVA